MVVKIGAAVAVRRVRISDGRVFGWVGTVTDALEVDGELCGIELRYSSASGVGDRYPQAGHTWLAVGTHGEFMTTVER